MLCKGGTADKATDKDEHDFPRVGTISSLLRDAVIGNFPVTATVLIACISMSDASKFVVFLLCCLP